MGVDPLRLVFVDLRAVFGVSSSIIKKLNDRFVFGNLEPLGCLLRNEFTVCCVARSCMLPLSFNILQVLFYRNTNIAFSPTCFRN